MHNWFAVPENLVVQPLSFSRLRATWDPPVCQKEQPIPYTIRVDYHDYSTTDTEYEISGLYSFTLYTVTVTVDRGYSSSSHSTSTDAFTLPSSE